ncbi:MAG: ATP-binding protein, partial [Desulfurococcaceae archaeon]
ATGTGKSRLVLALIKEVLEKTSWKIIVFDHSGLDYVKYFKEHVVDGSKIVLDIETISSYLARESDIEDKEGYLYLSLTKYIVSELDKQTEGSKPQTHIRIDQIPDKLVKIEDIESHLARIKWNMNEFIQITESVLRELEARKHTSVKIKVKLLLYSKQFFESLNERKITVKEIIERVNRNRIVIIDLSPLEQSAKKYVVKSVISKLWQIIDSTREPINTLIVIDEAHNYACERCYDVNYVITRTAREGRKWGLGLILASQRIVDFDAEIRNNINTFFFSRLQTPSDLQNLQNVLDLGGIGYENLAILTQREFFVAGLGNPLKYPILLKVKEIGE